MSFNTGKCLCGQITVSLPKEALDATDTICVCRCKNCCQASGSFGSINVFAAESDVKITGQPKIDQDNNTASGTPVQRAFCGNCGSPIYSTSPKMPGIQTIKLGLVDEIPEPSMEVYYKSRPSWDKPIDNAKQFEEMHWKKTLFDPSSQCTA